MPATSLPELLPESSKLAYRAIHLLHQVGIRGVLHHVKRAAPLRETERGHTL